MDRDFLQDDNSPIELASSLSILDGWDNLLSQSEKTEVHGEQSLVLSNLYGDEDTVALSRLIDSHADWELTLPLDDGSLLNNETLQFDQSAVDKASLLPYQDLVPKDSNFASSNNPAMTAGDLINEDSQDKGILFNEPFSLDSEACDVSGMFKE